MSEVVFSDAYSPLYDLLRAWDEVDHYSISGLTKAQTDRYYTLKVLIKQSEDNKDFIKELESLQNTNKSTEELEDLEYFIPLSRVDTVCLSGGRDSGKTFALACWNVVACADYEHRILYTRQTMTSTKNSIKEALRNRMILLQREGEFKYADDEFTLKENNTIGKITITGQKTSTGTSTAKLKSIEDYSVFQTEEAEETTSYDEWKKIKRSMRASDVQCLSILCFNPPTREHWIAKEFYEDIQDGFCGIRNNVLYIHTTYLDNGKENMADHNWREFEELREVHERVEALTVKEREAIPYRVLRKYEEYKYSILGGFKRKAEGVIYPIYTLKEFDETLAQKGFGIDFGSNDPDALVKVGLDKRNKRIFLKEEYFRANTSYKDLLAVLLNRCGKRSSIIGDCAERRMIIDLRTAGLNIHKSDKKMPVEDQIKMLQDYDFFIDPKSKNLVKAFNNYKWHDKKAGVPDHDWSDLMDGWRYKAYNLIHPPAQARVSWS